MYGVIMAGGGGTRLHPLSRAERPKPFLPLLGPESLLQATAARLRPLTDDITVVTDRRYEGLVREQLPDVAVAARATRAQHGRRHRPGRARHRSPARRGHDRPAGRPDHRTRGRLPRRPARRGRPPRDGRLRHRRPARHARRPARPRRPPSTATSCRPPTAARRSPASRRTRSAASRRSRTRPGPSSSSARRASPGMPACSCGDAGPSARPWSGTRVSSRRSGRWSPRRRCSSAPTNRSRRRCRSTSPSWRAPRATGASLMAAMDVGWSDLGSWTALLGALGSRGTGAVVQAGETVEVDADDLDRPADGRSPRGHRAAGAR